MKTIQTSHKNNGSFILADEFHKMQGPNENENPINISIFFNHVEGGQVYKIKKETVKLNEYHNNGACELDILDIIRQYKQKNELVIEIQFYDAAAYELIPISLTSLARLIVPSSLFIYHELNAVFVFLQRTKQNSKTRRNITTTML